VGGGLPHPGEASGSVMRSSPFVRRAGDGPMGS
jgi:hypothetical protein